MSKRKFEPLSNDNDEFVFLSASRQFKRFKTKSTSHINISNDENDKSSLPFNEFQSSAKNVDLRRNNSIIARSNFKKLVRN